MTPLTAKENFYYFWGISTFNAAYLGNNLVEQKVAAQSRKVEDPVYSYYEFSAVDLIPWRFFMSDLRNK